MDVAFTALQADITTLDVDVIVNAANAALCGGGGVDGAIHDAAGPALLAFCREHFVGGGSPGDAPFSPGFNLQARFIAHAIGPVWQGGDHDESILLARCYQNAIEGAVARGGRSIAFPSISTGAFRFPIQKAAPIAIEACRATARALPDVDGALLQITFCLFSARDLALYQRLLQPTLFG